MAAPDPSSAAPREVTAAQARPLRRQPGAQVVRDEDLGLARSLLHTRPAARTLIISIGLRIGPAAGTARTLFRCLRYRTPELPRAAQRRKDDA